MSKRKAARKQDPGAGRAKAVRKKGAAGRKTATAAGKRTSTRKAATAAGKRKTTRKTATTSGQGQRKAARETTGSKAPSRKARRGSRRPRVDPARLWSVLAILAERDPDPRCALDHADAYELLVATILSAQCTDVRVNQVTPALFTRYPTPAELARAEQADVEELIRSTGFFRNKARNLVGMARALVERFDGEVPQEMDSLLSLPGVARKTANVVLGTCFGIADGVVVDTHVLRISARLGFTRQTDPVRIEQDLMALLPREEWIDFSHRIIRLGRSLCVARKPRCQECPLRPHCPQVGV